MLLLDQNLSFRLVSSIEQTFPGCRHVRDFDLSAGSDSNIWDRLVRERLAILTKDFDFFNRSSIHGHPPKIIHIQAGNARTAEIAKLITRMQSDIHLFLADINQSYMILTRS